MFCASPTVLSNTGVKLSEKAYYELLIKNEAIRNHIDPNLAYAVVQVESGFDREAIGPTGDVGLFQLSPRFGKRRIQPIYNINTGIKELVYWKAHCPVRDGNEFLVCYNAGYKHPKHPELNTYYKKVMNEYKTLAYLDQ